MNANYLQSCRSMMTSATLAVVKTWANPGLVFVYFCPFLIPTTIQFHFQQFKLKKA